MPPRRTWIALCAALLCAVVVGVRWLGNARPVRAVFPHLPFHAGKITVSLVPAGGLTDAMLAEGKGGDYLVQNGRIAFVIGADAPGVERQARHGVLLDLTLKDFRVDELFDLRPVLRVEGKLVPLAVAGISLVKEGAFPFLRVEQVAQNGRLSLQTDFLAAPNAEALRLVSRFHNGSDALLRAVDIGERTRWPGAPTFVPRVGFPKDTEHAELSWLGREGARLSYALVFPEGAVHGSFLYDHVAQVGQETDFHVGDAPAGATLSYDRYLAVVEGNLASAADVVFRLLKRPVGNIAGRVEPMPAWAVIEAQYPDGKPALSVRAGLDGSFRLPLPSGDYRLVARSPGGEDSAEVSIEAGQKLGVRLFAPPPGRLEFLVTDEDNAPLAARLIVRGVAPTKDPELGPIEQGSGAHNVMYSRHGGGEMELPEGKYRVVITHGPEYELAERELEIDHQNGFALRAVLKHTVDTGGWLACDFHLHAAPSLDSNVSLSDRVLSLLAEGVEFAVPTDHNHITDYAPFARELSAEAELGSASGVEVTTPSWGHFNAYPYPSAAPPPPFSGVTPGEIFSAIRARAPNSVIQVNHPRMPGVGYFNRIELNPETGVPAAEGASFEFDAVEVVNGYDLESQQLIQSNLREYFALLNAGRRLTATGNSDSHRLVINWAGYPRTYVRVPDEQPGRVNAADVARAVADGHVLVANGIFPAMVVNGTAGPGDTVAGHRVTVAIDARAPSWVDLSSIELWVNAKLEASSPRALKPTPRGHLLWQTELDLPRDSWLVAVVRGIEPMTRAFVGRRILPFGFTNPVFVDADEDGVFRAPEAPEPAPR